jgi:hypothetical protein
MMVDTAAIQQPNEEKGLTMTVYFIEREYEVNIRIEVDDDTSVSFRQGYEDTRNSVVFSTPGRSYEEKFLAAFSNVQAVRKEGVSVQYLNTVQTKGPSVNEEAEWEHSWANAKDFKGTKK